MKMEYYQSHGITPVLQAWRPTHYSQQFKKMPYIPNLSIIDLLCNVEAQEARKILVSENKHV